MNGNGQSGSSLTRPRPPLSDLACTRMALLNGGWAETSARKGERTSANERQEDEGKDWLDEDAE